LEGHPTVFVEVLGGVDKVLRFGTKSIAKKCRTLQEKRIIVPTCVKIGDLWKVSKLTDQSLREENRALPIIHERVTDTNSST